jgi:hypothetical protein
MATTVAGICVVCGVSVFGYLNASFTPILLCLVIYTTSLPIRSKYALAAYARGPLLLVTHTSDSTRDQRL